MVYKKPLADIVNFDSSDVITDSSISCWFIDYRCKLVAVSFCGGPNYKSTEPVRGYDDDHIGPPDDPFADL